MKFKMDLPFARLDFIICLAVAFVLFAAPPAFAGSFGDAVANPDPWQMILGAIIPFVMAWMSGRFPLLATILKALGINLTPPVTPTPTPVDPTEPHRPLLDAIKRLLDTFLKRQEMLMESRVESLQPMTAYATPPMPALSPLDQAIDKLYAAKTTCRDKAEMELAAKVANLVDPPKP